MGCGEEEECGKNGESSMETYTLPYVNQRANGNLLYDSGNPNQCSVKIYMGGNGQEVEGNLKIEWANVFLWLIHVDVWQKSTQYYKANISQLKINRYKNV